MRLAKFVSCVVLFASVSSFAAEAARPNIVLVMADDQGWGETSYYNHPVLKTPNIDSMAAHGLRFDRFYAGAPNCSPTRSTVMTGRSNDRCGVKNHGYALRRQEHTVARALQEAGYATGHFGKWHLNGYRGPGAPILATDDHNPGEFGFDEWLSVTNFFDRDPIMSRKGNFEEFKGDSSDIIVDEALTFIRRQVDAKKPFFTVIWYGSPHSPWVAGKDDKSAFASLNKASQNHYGELVAMDRSIGTLRKGLRDMGVADNTLVWYCSDNGGLPKIEPGTVGHLRGFKGSVYEGGLRVPCVIEWPAGIPNPRTTSYPAATMDIFPTLAEIVGLSDSVLLRPSDGTSLLPLFQEEIGRREKPLAFRHTGRAAIIDNEFKLLTTNLDREKFELYDLASDPSEKTDVLSKHPKIAERLRKALIDWNTSVEASVAGRDYPEGRVDPSEPESRDWMSAKEYEPYIDEWKNRPEYKQYFQRKSKG